MENEKVEYLINMINDMDIKDKLRLVICMSQSKWSGFIYNTKENYGKFDKMLKEVDEEYRITLINFAKYKLAKCGIFYKNILNFYRNHGVFIIYIKSIENL